MDARMDMPPHARAGQIGRGHRFAAYPRCSVDTGERVAKTGGPVAKALGVGGIFFKSRSPRKLAQWYSRCLGFPLVGPTMAMFKPSGMPKASYTVWSVFSASS